MTPVGRRKYLYLGMLGLWLLSCDPRAKYDKYIMNNTPYMMTLVADNNRDVFNIYEEDSISITPYTKLYVAGESRIGSAVYGYADCPLYPEFDDTLVVQVRGPNNLLHELYITDNDDWEHFIISQDKKGENGRCECILNLKEENLPF